MPSPIISHQAPSLFIKIRAPKWIDGTSICIGACVVDINGPFDLIFLTRFINITHSFIGLFIFTVPLTVLFTILFCRMIGPKMSDYASKQRFFSKLLRYFGVDEWYMLKQKNFNKRFFIVAIYSAFLGGLTHILLDLPAHNQIELFYPWIFRAPDFFWTPIIDLGTLTIGNWQLDFLLRMSDLIWHVENVITFFLCLYLLRYIKKHDLIKKWYLMAGRI